MKKILFVSRWFPYPIDNGSKIRVFNLIRTLAQDHQIDLISFSSGPVSDERVKAMQRYCQRVSWTEYHADESNWVNMLRGYLSSKPRSAVVSHNPEMQSFIQQAEKSDRYDVVISSQIDMAAYTHAWRSSPLIFEEVELTTLYETYRMQQDPLKRMRARLMWLKSRQYVRKLLKNYMWSTVVSEQERTRVMEVAPDYRNIAVVPNGVDTNYLSGDFGDVEPDSLIYSGALSYYANMDAMEYFLQEVFPLIRQRRPGTKLYITGGTEGLNLKWIPQVEGVVFTGYLPDIRPRIARSMVSIVPLRIGGGTRLKILESLALKTPVVSTQKGAEGLDLVHGEDLLVAGNAHEFAEQVTCLLEDPPLRQRLGEQGGRTVRSRYDWSLMGRKLSEIVQTVV